MKTKKKGGNNNNNNKKQKIVRKKVPQVAPLGPGTLVPGTALVQLQKNHKTKAQG